MSIKDSGEIWKPIVGHEENYEVSNLGRVRSLRNHTRIRDKTNRIMRQKYDNKGYLRVNIYMDKKCKAVPVSRLVAMAFIPNPQNLKEVGHWDDNKENNTAENLYWTDRLENLTHNDLHLKIRDLRQKNIHKVVEALSIPVVATNIETGETLIFPSMQEAERSGMGFDSGKISLCCNGKRKSHKGYYWRKKV